MTGPVTNGAAFYNLEDDTLRWTPDERLDANEYALAKDAGFKWWGRTGAWVAVWTPGREDHLLARVEEVTHEADPDDPQARVLRFAGRAAAAVTQAAQRREAASQDLPPPGQPILRDHPSARRHVRALERSDFNMRKAQELHELAEHWRRRAQGTERRARQKSDPGVIRRRIDKLNADLRRQERVITDERTSDAAREYAQRWHAHLTLRIAFEEGRLASLNPEPFAPVTAYQKGDVVQHKRWGKCQVVSVGRVNLKLQQLTGATVGWQWAAPPHEVKPWTEPEIPPQPE